MLLALSAIGARIAEHAGAFLRYLISRKVVTAIVALLITASTPFVVPTTILNRSDLNVTSFGAPLPFVDQRELGMYLEKATLPMRMTLSSPLEHPTSIHMTFFILDFFIIWSLVVGMLYFLLWLLRSDRVRS